MVPPPGFESVRHDRTVILVRSDVRAWLLPLLQDRGGDAASYATRNLTSGRGGTKVVTVSGHDVVVRPCRRGGLPARLLHDIYFGLQPRPLREVAATETLRARGAPVVEVYGASVHWLAPGCYRGWVATRCITGAQTLWEWTCGARVAEDHEVVFGEVGRAIRRLHDSDGRHPDLNLNNILVSPGGEIVLIDFDRARLSARLWSSPETDLTRLRRSARKLDPAATRVTAADLERLEVAYRAGCP